jgi:hypothetical protein
MCRRLLKLAALVVAFFVLGPFFGALAQEPIPRGLGHPDGAAHWYQTGCCDKRDCEPVEFGAIIEMPDGYKIRYLTSRGFIAEGFLKHGDSGIRQSLDKDQHACATTQRILCIYIHLGV